jgi:hypothetical protein
VRTIKPQNAFDGLRTGLSTTLRTGFTDRETDSGPGKVVGFNPPLELRRAAPGQ